MDSEYLLLRYIAFRKRFCLCGLACINYGSLLAYSTLIIYITGRRFLLPSSSYFVSYNLNTKSFMFVCLRFISLLLFSFLSALYFLLKLTFPSALFFLIYIIYTSSKVPECHILCFWVRTISILGSCCSTHPLLHFFSLFLSHYIISSFKFPLIPDIRLCCACFMSHFSRRVLTVLYIL